MKRLSVGFVLFAALFVPQLAFAFCGFYVAGGDTKLYNDATQAVLMRGGDTTVLSMQNNYEGPPKDFAMVVPVPEVLQKENVKTLDKEIFDRVDKLSAPRLVEYWERDPCQPQVQKRVRLGNIGVLGSSGRGGAGRGFGGTVTVEAEFKVGEYDIVILSTNDSTALDGWLKESNYKIPDGAEPYFRPYVAEGMYFFVAKVDVEKVKYEDGEAVLSPLRFHYESEKFSLPIRLGMINSKGKQDLVVYILADQQRYQVANYPNVTIPTNIEVGTSARRNFSEFYEALYSRTVEENPKAVVTEYAWAAAKCDPCPSGMLGGGGLNPADLQTLGNDIIGKPATRWNTAGWTLTRLHARYAPDDIGEDLVFEKAEPIVGGREWRSPEGELEKGSNPSKTGNNFQGRYIIRHDWEGDVDCENPQHGNWGPPPDANGMRLVAETIVEELRRQAAATEGREPTTEELEEPWTDAERDAVAYHLRKRYGTSVPPMSTTAGPSTAPSLNTRGPGATLGGGGITLATVVRESIPELKVEPAPDQAEEKEPKDDAKPAGNATTGADRGGSATGQNGPATGKEDWPPGEAGCSTTDAGTDTTWPTLVVLLALVLRRRKDSGA